ncbi:MAG: SDR family oxidoreductase [Candidatus Andersenbacteria bacterium]|nr:SDR family oxidoreductase [Candidatus Andersenbacteria bacterium]MBI3250967.1 SDR family oxidoreductase [Candidatus Andersenbacteria bacterium]
MRILLTGGAGFIGSHLCDRLVEAGHSVICVDNFFTGQKKNIQHLLEKDTFELIEHDIIEPLRVEGKIDQIYNLACPASPIHYQKNPIRTVKANTIGMINVLGLAKSTGARLLQASTSEVYGDPDVHPQPETYNGNVSPLSPRACYDEGKRVAETLCMDYHREHGIEIRIARIFNTYGPRMHPDDGRVVSNFITQALADKPLTMYGEGKQTRSFCYVDDLVAGLIALMNNEKHIGPINIGNPTELTMKELAIKIVEMTESKSQVEYHPLPEADPRQRRPDISLAKKVLNWEPHIPLEEGLRKTIEYFSQL